MTNSSQGLRDGVDRFGSHDNKLSQDESGCWQGGGGGGEDEEELWSDLEVSACDHILCPSLYWNTLLITRENQQLWTDVFSVVYLKLKSLTQSVLSYVAFWRLGRLKNSKPTSTYIAVLCHVCCAANRISGKTHERRMIHRIIQPLGRGRKPAGDPAIPPQWCTAVLITQSVLWSI